MRQTGEDARSWPTAERLKVPCGACGKRGNCKRRPDGTWHCWKAGSNGTNGRSAHAGAPGQDWAAVADRCQAAMTPELLGELDAATGVPAAAWGRLSPGWADGEELRAMRAGGAGWAEDYPDGAWSFAERDGRGRVVGLSLRARDGRKGAPSGGGRGLILPADLHERSGQILVVEGASDVAACCAVGLRAVGRPSNRGGAEDLAVVLEDLPMLVVGENDGKPDGTRPGHTGAKEVATKLAGRWRQEVGYALPPHGAKDVRAWLAAKVAAGLNLADAKACEVAGTELRNALIAASREVRPERRTQAAAIIDLFRKNYRLILGEDGLPYGVPTGGPNIALPLKGGPSSGPNSVRAALAAAYFELTDSPASQSALSDAMSVMEGEAGRLPAQAVALRVAEHDGGVVLDLGDVSGRAVVVTGDGWRVVDVSPVTFRRTKLVGPLPEPLQADASELRDLLKVVNVTRGTFPLLAGYLVAALRPGRSYAIGQFVGEQGTAKTWAARLALGLIDPSPGLVRDPPEDPEQWGVVMASCHATVIDNVSGIAPWFSDALCKGSTGAGLVRRARYSDSDVSLLTFRRVITMTTIDAGSLRGDLADRLVVFDLERIDEAGRRTEEEVQAEYDKMKPLLLGALLTALSRTLGAIPGVRLKEKPRMADFAVVLAALDAACPELTGKTDGEGTGALAAFVGERESLARAVVDDDVVAMAIEQLAARSPAGWSGTCAELLDDIRPPSMTAAEAKKWPAMPEGLARRLTRLRPALSRIGVEHVPPKRTDKTRVHTVGRQTPPTTAQPPRQPPENRPRENPPGAPENAVSGGSGGSGGSSAPISISDERRGRRRYVADDLTTAAQDALEAFGS
jgi:hypothetical protein